MVKPGIHSLLTLTSELNVHLFQKSAIFRGFREIKVNLYLLQGLLDDKFSSPDVLVGKKCPNLVEVELCGEVGCNGGDDVSHGETPRVELLKDLLPVALQVAPCRKSTCNPLNYKKRILVFDR